VNEQNKVQTSQKRNKLKAGYLGSLSYWALSKEFIIHVRCITQDLCCSKITKIHYI